MAVLKDLIVHGTSRFLNGSRFNTINAESIGAEQGIFNKLIATTLDAKEATIDNLTAQNATVVGLLDVQGELHTNAWTNANIANIGGSFYISPTVEPTDGTTTISITRVSATSWTVSATGTFATDFIKSGTATSGVAWPANSLVLITGDVIIGDMVYPLGTLKGTLNAAVTATAASTSKTITITGVTDAQNNNAPSVLQELYEINSSTNISNAPFKKGKISLYKLGSNPIGILMTSMGTSSNSLMDIYGGVSTNPSVRIGHLAGLPNINGSAPTGWGIYTDNGYFSGVIVSNSGKIANFTINGSKLYSNGHDTYNKAVTGIYIGDDYISFGSGGVTYFNTSGTGKIGPWTLTTTALYNGKSSYNASVSGGGVYIGTDYIAGGNGEVWWLKKDGSAKIGAMTLSSAGVLSVPAANITGTLDAARIAANSITVGKIDPKVYSYSNGGQGTGYAKLFTISHTESYHNAPISFLFHNRGKRETRVTFNYTNNGTPASAVVQNATYDGETPFYYVSKGSGVYDVYFQLAESYDDTYVTDYVNQYSTGLTVTWEGSYYGTSLPSEAVSFTRLVGSINKSTIDGYAQTATSYITNIDSNKGITIKPLTSTGNDYLQINSSAIEFYRNSTTNSVMSLTDDTFRIGLTASGHSTVKSDGLHIWTGIESTATNEKAFFGTTARIGQNNTQRLEVTSSGIDMYTSDNQKRIAINSSSGVIIGRSDKNHILLSDSALTFYGSNGTSTLASYGSEIKLYNPTTNNVAAHITSSGATFTGGIVASSLTINSGATVSGDGASQILNSEIKIGGRNLLLNTTVSTSNISKIRANTSYTSVVTEDGIICYKITGSNTAHLFNSTDVWDCMAEKLKANTTYTYSAWIKSSKGGILSHTFLGYYNVSNSASTASDKTHEDTNRIYYPETIIANTWTKISVTFTTNSLAGSSFGVYPVYNTGSDTILYIYGFMLEEGNKATDWTPAPEDAQFEIISTRSWYATCDTAAATTAKVATISPTTTDFTTSVLTTGTVVFVKFTYTNSGAVGSLTLNVNNTGAKPIKTTRNGSLTNIAGADYIVANSTYQFIYDGTNWIMQENYNANTYDRTYHNNPIKAATAITAGHIICGTSAGYKNIGPNVAFDLSYPILYSPNAISAGSTRSDCYIKIPSINATNNGSTITNATQFAILYLKGTLNNNTFTISASPFLTCTVPNDNDGFCYIPLGIMTNNASPPTTIYFESSDQLYKYVDGAFGPVSMRQALAAAKTATNCITEISNAGIWVTPSGKKPDANGDVVVNSTTGTLINADGVGIYKSGTKVAQYGDTVTIGQETSGSLRTKIDNDTFWITNGTTDIAFIGNENKTVTDTFVSDGSTLIYTLNSTWLSGGTFSPSSVTGSKVSGENKISVNSGTLPAAGETFTYTYTPSSAVTYYTMGTRNSSAGIGDYSFAEGKNVISSGLHAHAEGYQTEASGRQSHAEGYLTHAYGNYSHAEGLSTYTYGSSAHAEGNNTRARGYVSHAEGEYCKAEGDYSHAEGFYTEVSGDESHAEGSSTRVSGNHSHAEGASTIVSGDYSHGEGYTTVASGNFSHSEGSQTIASGYYSHAQNYNTIAQGMYQTVIGKYNIPQGSINSIANTDYAFIIGNGTGTSDENLSNALTVDWNGTITANGYICNNIGGNSSTTHASTLQTWFNNHKSSISRNTVLSYWSNAYGNGSQYIGYFLNGYDTTPYGGFFVCHYETPRYVGISNGTYTQYELTKTTTSSRKTKENIKLMTGKEAKKLYDLNVISFDYKKGYEEGKKNQFGLIAEDCDKIIPYVVCKPDDNENSIWGIDYTKFVPYLIKNLQLHEETIEKLNDTVQQLMDKVDKLESEIKTLKS